MGQNDLVAKINIELLLPNPYQPRKNFTEQSLQELALSIKTYGIINPILVRPKNDKYEIIAGERRVKAAKLIGLTEIPAIIRNIDDKKMGEIALIENIQHESISSIEEARSYKEIIDTSSINENELSNMIGKSPAFISNKIRLLNLPNEIQDALINRKISEKHARSLLTVSDTQKQIELLNRVINNRLTVKDLDDILKEENLKEEKKEEKESDIMNNDNFFPSINSQPNNNVSLNTMNMQTTPQDTQTASIGNFNQTPILDPNVIQFPTQDTNTFGGIQTTPAPAAPTETPITSAIEEVATPPVVDNSANNNLTLGTQTTTEQPLSLPTAPIFGAAETSVQQPAAPTENNNQFTVPTADNVSDIPLFATQNIEQPQMPEAVPAVQPAPALEIPGAPTTNLENNSTTTTNEAPLFAQANQGLNITEPTPTAPATNTPVVDIPVTSAPGEEDKFSKVKALLDSNSIQYKAYSNETNHCIIIEI